MMLHRDLPARNAHRLVWSTQADKTRWQPLYNAINSEWPIIERKSVLAGLRDCTLQPLSKGQYLQVLPWAMQNGLYVRAVKTVKAWAGAANFYEDGDDFVITAIAREQEMLEAPEQHLSYPACCQRFFAAYWPVINDPVWQWATQTNDGGKHEVTVSASPYSDPTLRYANIRFSPHIPCHPQCQASIALGVGMGSLMAPDLRDARLELFSQPRSWDAYRSMAIVKTGPFRMIVGSIPAAERYLVHVLPN
jgi:hypothetical protein